MDKPATQETIKLYKSATLLRRYINTLQYRKDHPETISIYSTGFGDLDALLAGGIGKWYIGIVAPQKMGKTIFLKHLVKQVSRQGAKVMEISLEMGEEMTAQRMLADLSGMPMNQLRRPDQLSINDFDRLWAAQKSVETWDTVHNFTQRTIDKMERLITDMKPDFVSIDYIGLISTDTFHKSTTERIQEISRRFKAMTLPRENKDEPASEDLVDQLMMTLDMRRDLIGTEATDQAIAWARKGWEDFKALPPEEDVVKTYDLLPESQMGLFTASQTSKENQRRAKDNGGLDETAPKDSQAMFEDCDLGLVLNPVLGHDDKPLPHLREIKIVVSRVSKPGELIVGINTDLARMYEDKMYCKTDVTNLTDMFN